MNTPIHAAIVIDAWFPGPHQQGITGGGQVHVQQLTQALQKQFPFSFKLFFPSKISLWFRAWWSLFIVMKVVRSHRQKPFQVIHSHGFNAGIAAKLSSFILGIPLIHTVHGSALMDQHQPSFKAMLEKWILTQIRYSHQISVSATFNQYPNVNQVTIIPNGVDVYSFDQLSVKKSTRPCVIWVGRSEDPIKGFHLFTQAINQIKQVFPNLDTLVANGQLQGNDLIRAYKQAHVFVLSSLGEGQPLTVLEAWAAKLPVVATKVGDVPRLVKASEGGVLVDPGQSDTLAQAILSLLKNPRLAASMGESGHRYISKHHQWPTIAKKTWKVYQSVL